MCLSGGGLRFALVSLVLHRGGDGRAVEARIASHESVELVVMHKEVLQRHRPTRSAHDKHAASLSAADPLAELLSVGGGGAEEDQVDGRREHDDDLLPDHPALSVVYVVHLVKDDHLDVAD